MSTIVAYDHTTGEIFQVTTYPGTHMDYGYPECLLLLDGTEVSDLLDYVSGGVVTPRPILPGSLVGNLLIRVPTGAAVYIDGQTYTADGTDIELEFTYPGTYSIKVECWPYLGWVGEVTV